MSPAVAQPLQWERTNAKGSPCLLTHLQAAPPLQPRWPSSGPKSTAARQGTWCPDTDGGPDCLSSATKQALRPSPWPLSKQHQGPRSVPRHRKTCREGLPHQDQARKRPKDSNSQCRGLTRLYSPARPPTCSDDLAAPGSPWLRDMKCTRSKPGQLSTPLLQVATSTHPWLQSSQWNSKKKAAQDLVRTCNRVSTSQGQGNTTAALPFSASPFQRRNCSCACPYISSDEIAALPALTLPATKL